MKGAIRHALARLRGAGSGEETPPERPASAVNPDFAALFALRGIDPAAAEAAIRAKEADVARRLRDGVLAEMAAKAAALQPLLDIAPERRPQPVVTPFGRDALAPSAALAAMQAAAGWRRARAVVVADTGDGPAAALIETLAAILSREEVLLILTGAPAPTPGADGPRAIGFAGASARVRAEGERRELLFALIRSLGPAHVFGVGSALFRGMMAQFGEALAASSAIHVWRPAQADREDERLLVDCAEALSGVITETEEAAAALRARHLMPPDWAARVLAAPEGDWRAALAALMKTGARR